MQELKEVVSLIYQTNKMNTAKLIQIASSKGLSIASDKKTSTYQYSANGFEWTIVNCSWNEFVKIIIAL